ncbi:pyridoxal phosphate-dependent aminotransferase [Mycobacterium sp. NPDC050441]|uniref:pyridoxal phosphate-dependent aminotransferase n=1 Tax=Mycobacterium sp. NPDC050441 TaxID=3155403 RepID=UPI0033F9825F
MLTVSRTVSAVSPSATMVVAAKSEQLRATGRHVLSLAAGEPDYPPPDHVLAAAAEACSARSTHRYSGSSGFPELRAAMASAMAGQASPDEVVVTNGAKQAVYLAMAVLLNAGDEVLIPTPYWTTYPEAARLVGALPVFVRTSLEGKVTAEALEEAWTDRSRMVVIGSPSNPTGAVYSITELEAIAEWALRRRVTVISDEVYEHLIFDGRPFATIREVSPEIAAATVTVHAVSKTYGMTGWRVGWLHGPGPIAAAAAKMQSHLTSNVSNIAQAAALAALRGGLEHIPAAVAAFTRRRDLMLQVLQGLPGVHTPEPAGAFYCFPDISEVLSRGVNGRQFTDSIEFATYLLDELGIAVVPGEAFGAPGHIRLSFAASDRDVVDAMSGLQRMLGGWSDETGHTH